MFLCRYSSSCFRHSVFFSPELRGVHVDIFVLFGTRTDAVAALLLQLTKATQVEVGTEDASSARREDITKENDPLNAASPSKHEHGQKRKVALEENDMQVTAQPLVADGLLGVKHPRRDEGGTFTSPAFESTGATNVSCCHEC